MLVLKLENAEDFTVGIGFDSRTPKSLIKMVLSSNFEPKPDL